MPQTIEQPSVDSTEESTTLEKELRKDKKTLDETSTLTDSGVTNDDDDGGSTEMPPPGGGGGGAGTKV